jgi:1A family penicillin-binding protein
VIKKTLIKIGRPIFRAGMIVESKLSKLARLRKKESTKKQKPTVLQSKKLVKMRWGYLVLTLTVIGLTSGLAWMYREVINGMPNINQIYTPPNLSSKIYDRNGRLLYKFYESENRTWIPLDKIPQDLIWATIAIEDKDFYNHHGLSFKGIAKAIIYNFSKDKEEKVRGGSTITQQLIKNIFFGGEQSLKRKIREAILAIILETKMSKKEILERYFNEVPYGGEAYGVQEASWKYFGKNVWEVNLKEAAFLAGLPAAPSSYSPFGDNPDFAFYRQKHVLEEMAKAGYISPALAEATMSENLELKQYVPKIWAPHFVFFVKDWLEQKKGFVQVGRQGLSIWTSIDSEIQNWAENIVAEEIHKVRNLRISNGAALIIDVNNGDILAMVGSKDYNALDIDGKYNVTTALRQPGSAIKPINYLLAIERGATPLTILEDSPVKYEIVGQKPYVPQNYNGKYMGKVPLKVALASSLNIPSVKLLAQNGVENMIDMGEKMGITTWKDRSRFGLSLALGGGEVKMTELAQAYSIFANLGGKVEIDPIVRIDNYLGETISRKNIFEKQVIDPGRAYLINSMLSDNNARMPIFGANSRLKIDNKTVAVKTGTTNNLKDNWCIGWTPSFLVAAWVGNNDSTPMSWVASGVSGATPIWQRLMKQVLTEKPNESWEIPDNVGKFKVCGDREEYLIKGSEKSIECVPSPTPTTTIN